MGPSSLKLLWAIYHCIPRVLRPGVFRSGRGPRGGGLQFGGGGLGGGEGEGHLGPARGNGTPDALVPVQASLYFVKVSKVKI